MTDLGLVGGEEVSGEVEGDQRIFRRLTTTRGALISQPNDGIDLRSFLRSGVLTTTPGQIQSAVRAELLKDQDVLKATVGVTWTAATSTLTVTMQITWIAGPSTMQFVLTPASIAIIVNGLPASWSAAA
jgi:hypothetical protein